MDWKKQLTEYNKIATYHFEELKKAKKEKNNTDVRKLHKSEMDKYDKLAFDIICQYANLAELYDEFVSKETPRAIRSIRYFKKNIRYLTNNDKGLEQRERWAIDLLKVALTRAERPVISCSFGIDSMVTLHITRKALIEMGKDPTDIDVVWCNTLNEFPEVRMFAKQMTDEWNLKLSIYKPKKALKQVIDSYGGIDSTYFTERKGQRNQDKRPLSEKCCETLKHEPMHRAIKSNSWDLQINGVRADESAQRFHAQLRDGEYFYSKREWKAYALKPIAWFTNDDVWEYARKEGIPYVKMYDNNLIQKYPEQSVIEDNLDMFSELGVDIEKLKNRQLINLTKYQANFAEKIGFQLFTPRVGCMMCPIPVKYGYMQFMRTYYPKVYDAMVHKLGYGKVLLEMIPDDVKEELKFFLNIDLDADNAHEYLKDILEAKPCVFDKFD